MDLEVVLKTLGLSAKEAKIYLACLQYGELNVSKIAQFSGLKRSTCYAILEGLVTKKLVISPTMSDKKRYHAVEPAELLFHVEHQKQLLEQYLPTFNSLAFQEAPHFGILSGSSGLPFLQKQIESQSLVYIVGSFHTVTPLLRNLMLGLFSQMKTGAGKIHLYLPPLPHDIAFSEQHADNFQIRFVPRGTIFDSFSIISEFFCATFITNKSDMQIIFLEHKGIMKTWWQMLQLMDNVLSVKKA
ncbi:MAG: hypothetical protein A3B74_05225 [Candidatus Kerfeldbacteria bacterium RIFCSPHIGHO2_02_FULL_42_14]|uniref:Transcription regulator TrmB N-terminal domain-containing protein n=1 Tax=Candidatus Kerfeldbacteria bacterium RIFCSPHIGHO2_02_FULL_42_14 TaxID=1798540 RepID=A0A1G2AVP8_9BACT|nr:MAG: hypothetical protein A3B74_05225 [Candidatus Kerfeldbacteria bacterium RIFCSPHIGHO2_02_FULL_42_14]OGY81602.1 MAG: hypothetical protein A3E60_02020 [Candidatus Kerfeldbacteria bacterium RIFCSPHIGHO2_12_FULL_42_13]OGY83205.1 MAG: hypothetical protein A3I91_03430 [Candidatus Kerfeldbacteria bacterium RIFCSPLOWO2_02_FULL_42_19]OGY86242.1 MAG: hypothetical protein A3G01_00190 [Candidatus Kerfeldbacteria bacterium RIFCSPLOWO2_12_FULL_43_9]